MVKVSAQDYEALKGFFAWMCDHVLTIPPGLPAEDHPVATLSRFEARSMSTARLGLGMAIGDIIEETEDLSTDDVVDYDRRLAAAGLPTLSEIRARFWSNIAGIMRRGAVRTENEYYALRNVVEAMAEPDQTSGWNILADFEAKVAMSAQDSGKG